MGGLFQSQQIRSKKFWMGFVIFISVVAAMVYKEVEKKTALKKAPSGAPVRTSSPLESQPSSTSRVVVPETTSFGQRVDYTLKPSLKGSVKLLINEKENLYLISDLRPIPCPQKSTKMCLSLKSGNYIEADSELIKMLPVEYQYFNHH